MRIVSWNLGFAFNFRRTHDRAWHYLAALDPDIALLQEVLPPAWARDRWHIEMLPIRDWGTAVAAKPRLRLQRMSEGDAYSVTGTVSLSDGTELLVASVHTQVGKALPGHYVGLDPEAVRRPRQAVPHHNDIAYAFHRERVQGRRFLVSGDWNIARL